VRNRNQWERGMMMPTKAFWLYDIWSRPKSKSWRRRTCYLFCNFSSEHLFLFFFVLMCWTGLNGQARPGRPALLAKLWTLVADYKTTMIRINWKH